MSHGTITEGKKVKNGSGNGHVPAPAAAEYEAQPPAPPDGGWGWVVVFASFMAHIITDGITYSFGVFFTEFLKYFNEGKGKTAWIVSILVGVTLSSGPLSSSMVNRWGCRVVTVIGAFIAGFCVCISAFANNVNTLILTIGVGAGFGFGLIYLPAVVSVTVWFDKRRSLATGIAVCGAGLGTLAFAPLTAALIESYGWRGAMLIIGAITLNCIPLGIMFRPVPEPARTESQKPMLSQNSPLRIRSHSTEILAKDNEKSVESNNIERLTLSQPALNEEGGRKKSFSLSREGSGIMLRPDVLYTGSVLTLSQRSTRSLSNINNTFTKTNIRREEDNVSKLHWLPCSREFKQALSKMLDFSLFIDPIFLIFTISNFLTSVGYYVPYVYLVPMSNALGIENSPLLLSIVGASNLIGRIFLGYISDFPGVDRLLAYNICLTIAGVGTVLSAFCWEFWGLAAYCVVFGFAIGAYVGLTSVVLVDLLGLERLTNAFGILLLFQGIASLLGPPFAGWLYDVTESYAPGFYVAGGAIAVSGVVLFLIPLIMKRQQHRDNYKYAGTALEEI